LIMTLEQVQQLVRKNVREMRPYSSARDEFEGTASVYLDANENPFNTGYNRYPDPHQRAIKAALAKMRQLAPSQIFLGNGSDEAIDLLIRVFCEPGRHNVLIPQPTYGMYQVSADINDVAVRSVPLTNVFDIDVEEVLKKVDSNTRIIFLCSPNNPSGNLLATRHIESILQNFGGVVVLDEAYIDFASTPSWTQRLNEFPNLLVLQTFSKAWGLANLRLGMAFSNNYIIEMLNKVKPPYNISGVTQQIALDALQHPEKINDTVATLVQERQRLRDAFGSMKGIQHVFHSDANFLLVKMESAREKYNQLLEGGIVVRDRSNVRLCEDCLRITVGTREENDQLLDALRNL